MERSGSRDVVNRKARATHLPAPVGFLQKEKIGFGQKPHALEHFASYEEHGPQHGFNFNWRAHRTSLRGEATRYQGFEQPNRKHFAREARIPVNRILQTPVWMNQLNPRRADLWMFFEESEGGFDRTGFEHDIAVEQ